MNEKFILNYLDSFAYNEDRNNRVLHSLSIRVLPTSSQNRSSRMYAFMKNQNIEEKQRLLLQTLVREKKDFREYILENSLGSHLKLHRDTDNIFFGGMNSFEKSKKKKTFRPSAIVCACLGSQS